MFQRMFLTHGRPISPAPPQPMQPLRVQTTSGKLTITAQSVTLEKPTFPRVTAITIPRASISSVASRPGIQPLFGMGGNCHLMVYTLDGRSIELKGIPFKARRAAPGILQPDAL